MTTAERALLLAVAKYMMEGSSHPYSNRCRDLNKAIAAVEAEAAPEQPGQSCGDCGNSKCQLVGGYEYPACTDAFIPRQPKPTEADVCPVCKGTGMTVFNACQDMCWTCDGTGRKK